MTGHRLQALAGKRPVAMVPSPGGMVNRAPFFGRFARGRGLLSSEAPLILDLLALAAEAGLHPQQSLALLAGRVAGPMGEVLEVARGLVALGSPPCQAVDDASRSLAMPGEAFVGISRAWRLEAALGLPSCRGLRREAAAVRRRSRLAWEERMGLVPLGFSAVSIFYFLPPTLLLLLLPAILSFLAPGLPR